MSPVRLMMVAVIACALAGCPGTRSSPPPGDGGADWGWPFGDLWPVADFPRPADLPAADIASPGDGAADFPSLGDLGNPNQVVLVVLNQARTGNLGGIQGADALCQTQAQAAGAPGTFRAFLSSSTQDVKDLVGGPNASLPVVNNKGQQLFSSWSAVFSTTEWAGGVDLYTFSGLKVQDDTGGATDGDLWHGSKPSGVVYAGKTCQDWTSASSSEQGANGESDQHELLRQELHDCDNTFAVVCVRLVP